MKNNPIGKSRPAKFRFEIELEGEAALAFHKALELFQITSGSGPRQKNRFACWLLGRAADAYAVAPTSERAHWWRFELRPRTSEEIAAEGFLQAPNIQTAQKQP